MITFREWLREKEVKDLDESKKYYTIPEKIIGNEFFVLQRDLSKLFNSVKSGNDLNITEWNKLKSTFLDIDKSIISNDIK